MKNMILFLCPFCERELAESFTLVPLAAAVVNCKPQKCDKCRKLRTGGFFHVRVKKGGGE